MTAFSNSSDTSRQTLVEAGTAFYGTVQSSCPIVVNGVIEGTVNAPEITVTPLGSIVGAIKADKLTSSGTLSGKIDAVHVLLSGSVLSKTVVRAELLDVKIHSERGQLEVTFGAPRNIEPQQEAGGDEATAPEPADGWPASEKAPVESKLETRRGRRAQRNHGRQQR